VAAIGDRWPEVAAQDTYPEALRAFVDGLLGLYGSRPAARNARS
jgi:hypothetical protein